MALRRIYPGLAAGLALAAACVALNGRLSAGGESKLATEAAKAERILIGTPEQKGIAAGKAIDVPPGEPFLIEINRALRGTGRKASLARIINGGDDKQHPQFIAGQQYVFLLKKDADTKRWINIGTAVMPIKEGKVQYLDGSKVIEEIALSDFEELAAKDAAAVADTTPTRDSLTDKWIVVFSERNGMDAYLWLIDLGQGGTKGSDKQGGPARLLSSSKLVEATTLKTSSIADGDVHLLFDADGTPLDFQGRFENGTVRGSLMIGAGKVVPARMVPTDVKNMRRYDDPVADPAREEFIDAVGQEESFGPLLRFARRHPQSPLTVTAFVELIGHAKSEGYDRERFEKLAAEYIQAAKSWGPRIELRAYVELGTMLSRSEFQPELALSYLNTAEQKFNKETPADWKLVVQIERGKQLIETGKESEGVKLLAEVRERHPFEGEVTYVLARQAEKEKRIDDAIELYGELVALPLLQQDLIDALKSLHRKPAPEQYPSRVLARLWTEKHGNRAGLSDWLDELYEKKIRAIATDKVPPREKGQGTKVVLCELFTNGDCRPCVGADVATEALENTFARSEVIVLRYHQQKPGPDPLANEESQERFKQYQLDGTPTLIINGRRSPPGGGFMPQAPQLYQIYRSIVEPILKEKTELRLELSAAASQGKIAISAKATGFKEFPPDSRLMLVLAEEKIDCPLDNGIRTHGMIVRAFAGGIEGTAPVKGKLSYTGEIDLGRLKKRISKHLTAIQRETDEEFDEIPLDFKSLQLVGILQNAQSGEVLQAAAVPVTGSTAIPAESKSSAKSESAGKPGSGGN